MLHLLEHNRLSPWQSGFHPRYATSTTLLHNTSEWYLAVCIWWRSLCQCYLLGHIQSLLHCQSWAAALPTCWVWFRPCCLSVVLGLYLLTGATALPSATSSRMKLQSPLVYHTVLGPLLFSLFVNSLQSKSCRGAQRCNSLLASIRAGKATAIRAQLLTYLFWPFCLLPYCMITGMVWPLIISSITSSTQLN